MFLVTYITTCICQLVTKRISVSGYKIVCSVSTLGMRICTDLLKDHVRAFSVLSTYKHACIGLNMAGAHGGIKLSGEGYSVKEMKNVIEGYGRELTKKRFLGI